MPMPVSCDGEVQRDAVFWRRFLSGHAKNDLALVGKLDGVPEQIDQNLAQASGSPLNAGGTAGPTSTISSRPFC
jgi:hypothetical protein